jgi:hypothetical protein
MSKDRGRNIPLSLPRRWVNDLLYFAQKVPTVAGERMIRIKPLVDLRRTIRKPPAWSAIMTKAVGIVSMRIPELRRAYMPYPWPHLYEAPHSVASVVFFREYLGEHAAFIAPMLYPERRSLTEIEAKVESLRTDPIEKHGSLRRLIRTSKYPTWMRRMAWRIGMYSSGYFRACNFGTFAINSLAAMRGKMLQTVAPITMHMYYGVPEKNGEILVQLGFDHRVFDAYTLVKANSELETVLNTELLDELRAIKEKASSVAPPPSSTP